MNSTLGKLLCAGGVHDDGERISAMHPSPTCLRCDRPVTTPSTPTYRGSWLMILGVLMIGAGLAYGFRGVDLMVSDVLGCVLVAVGGIMVWRQEP
jgi:hypothetical protein